MLLQFGQSSAVARLCSLQHPSERINRTTGSMSKMASLTWLEGWWGCRLELQFPTNWLILIAEHGGLRVGRALYGGWFPPRAQREGYQVSEG